MLREVQESDLPLFFEHQLDPLSQQNVGPAHVQTDWQAFRAKWQQSLRNKDILLRTIVYQGVVAGYVASFDRAGKREASCWLDRRAMGKGVATQAVAELLSFVTTRPLYARVAKHNVASRRVLEKSGFVLDDNEPEAELFYRLD
jgi:RimJ/RimL family protein N-acetyltransferase